MSFISNFWEWFRHCCCGPRRRRVEQDLPTQGTSPTLTTPLLEPDDNPLVLEINSTYVTMGRGPSTKSHAYFQRAAKGLDSRGRLMLLQEMHRALCDKLDLLGAAEVAAQHDDLPCFLYAYNNGAFSYGAPMEFAAQYGALSILRYGFRRKDEVRWYYPHYISGQCTWDRALSAAAEWGHLACVRFLHERGVPLWDHVKVTSDHWFDPVRAKSWGWMIRSASCLFIPESRHLLEPLWEVLRYGEMHGAPLPESAVSLFKARRARAREVLLCFQWAARLRMAEKGHMHLWGVMARVPMDVVYKVLVGAELEMEVTFKPSAPRAVVGGSSG